MSERAPVILHAGALGDLILTLHLAMRLLVFQQAAEVRVYARSALPDGIGQAPTWRFAQLEGLRPEALYHDDTDLSDWKDRLAGRFVLSALGGVASLMHKRLESCAPSGLLSLDPVVQDDTGRHVVDRWATQLHGQGALARCCARATPKVVLPTVARSGEAGALLVIHPGSGGRTKCWDLDGFRAVADLWAQAGGRVRFVLGEVEAETWADDAVAGAVLCATRGELIEQLRLADVFLGNDSGPSHLGAWLGRATVVVFGPTDPGTWRPLGCQVQVVRGQVSQAAWGIAPAEVFDRLRVFADPARDP